MCYYFDHRGDYTRRQMARAGLGELSFVWVCVAVSALLQEEIEGELTAIGWRLARSGTTSLVHHSTAQYGGDASGWGWMAGVALR